MLQQRWREAGKSCSIDKVNWDEVHSVVHMGGGACTEWEDMAGEWFRLVIVLNIGSTWKYIIGMEPHLKNCVSGMPHESCLLRTSCTLSAGCFLLHAASGSGGVLLVRFSGTPGKLLCVKPQRLEARGELSPDKVPHVFLGLFVESWCSSKRKISIYSIITVYIFFYNEREREVKST